MRTRGVAFLAALVVVAVVPAAAIGAKATNGTATVSLAVGVTPAKAGTSSQPQRVALSYKQSLTANDGSRLGNDISQIKVAFAKGFRFDINAVAQCKESVLEDPNQGPSACPAKSIVGTGKATADARPTLPDPIDATVTAFNGMLDTDATAIRRPPSPRSSSSPRCRAWASGRTCRPRSAGARSCSTSRPPTRPCRRRTSSATCR